MNKLIISIIFLFVGYACRAKEITIGIATFPVPSDITDTRSVNKSQILRQIYDSLFFVDEFGKYRSVYFRKWKFNSTSLSYEFSLKENIKYSDGTPILAEDIIIALQSKLKSELLDNTSGIKLIKTANKNKTILISLYKDDSTFLVKLTDIAFSVYKKGPNINEFPVGSGVFKVTFFDKNKIIIERNPFHPDFTLGNINKITFVLIEKSKLSVDDVKNLKLDFFPLIQIDEAKKNLNGFKRIIYPSHRVTTLVFNIKDHKLRRVIKNCINPNEFLSMPYLKYDSISYNSIIPSGIENYKPTLNEFKFSISNCSSEINKISKEKFRWLNIYNSSEDVLFISSIIEKINLIAKRNIIELLNYSLNEAQSLIKEGKFDIFLCSTGPSVPLLDSIFADFVFTHDKTAKLIKYYDSVVFEKFSLLKKKKYNSRNDIASTLEATLIKRNWILPISRKVSTFYIPDTWTGLEMFNGMNGNFYFGKVIIND